MADNDQIRKEATQMGIDTMERKIDERLDKYRAAAADPSKTVPPLEKRQFSKDYEEARNEYLREARRPTGPDMGIVAKKKGGKVGSASKRADGCAIRGKTKGRMV